MASVEQVRVHLGERSYNIFVSPGLLKSLDNPAVDALRHLVADRAVLVVADSNTQSVAGETVVKIVKLLGAASCAMHVFPAGENSKNLTTIEAICRSAFQAHLDRRGLILAVGGGVTGDMAGFAASIYMRGIEYAQIPTSLLAMIDSSVGGKTGADLPDGKNLVGTFHQPRLVFMDVDLLKTLPPEQLRSGFAE